MYVDVNAYVSKCHIKIVHIVLEVNYFCTAAGLQYVCN